MKPFWFSLPHFKSPSNFLLVTNFESLWTERKENILREKERRTILILFLRWFDGFLCWCEIMTPIDYRLVWWRMSPILVHIHHGACQAWPRALTPLTPSSAGRKTNHHHWSGEKRSPTVSKKILYNFISTITIYNANWGGIYELFLLITTT